MTLSPLFRRCALVAVVMVAILNFASTVLASEWILVAQADPEATAAIGIMFSICICSGVFGLAIAGGISYFVYTDAVKHRVENPALWALVCFFTGLIGLLIYFLAIRPKYVK